MRPHRTALDERSAAEPLGTGWQAVNRHYGHRSALATWGSNESWTGCRCTIGGRIRRQREYGFELRAAAPPRGLIAGRLPAPPNNKSVSSRRNELTKPRSGLCGPNSRQTADNPEQKQGGAKQLTRPLSQVQSGLRRPLAGLRHPRTVPAAHRPTDSRAAGTAYRHLPQPGTQPSRQPRSCTALTDELSKPERTLVVTVRRRTKAGGLFPARAGAGHRVVRDRPKARSVRRARAGITPGSGQVHLAISARA